MKMFKEPIVVLDTETTGFHREAELIELGAICLDEWGRERSSFSALIKPKIIDDWKVRKALQVSKISPESLNEAEDLEKIRSIFYDWIEKIPSTDTPKCIAFNTNFDRRILERSGIHLSWGYCLLQMTKELMAARKYIVRGKNGQPKPPSLKDTCIFFGIEYPINAHRALEDAKITSLIATKIFPLWRELPEKQI
jgi:DNA polymerase III epsilon subunit-like protein